MSVSDGGRDATATTGAGENTPALDAPAVHGSVASGTPKLGWSDLPLPLRARIEVELGGQVLDAVVQPGGFSPGAPLRVRLGDGRRAFVKSASADINADTGPMYAREAQVVERLTDVPHAPRLLGWFAEGPWTTLMFEDIDGAPPALPWRRDQLGRVLDALADMAEQLTPSPLRELPALSERLAEEFAGWVALAGDPGRLAAVEDPWIPEHLDLLADTASGWPAVADGRTLVHGDIRADQILLTPGQIYIVDWAHAAVGAPLADTFFMLPSVVVAGGFELSELLAMSPLTASAAPDDLVSLGSALASYFIERSTALPPPSLPTLRGFQRDQGQVLVDWLKSML